MARAIFAVNAFCLGVLGLARVEPNAMAASSDVTAAEASSSLVTFRRLLLEYKKHPECYEKLSQGQKTYDDVDPRYLAKLNPKILEARFKEYNPPYQPNAKIEAKLDHELGLLKSRLDNTPLSDYGRRAQMEINYRAAQDQLKKARNNLCLLSVQANTSMLDALETLNAEEKKALVALPKKEPKMPFRVLGSREDRLQQSEAEKPNLTPVDDEFYMTQLGKKLEQDLGGRADYWSYDFDKDELYVKVKDELGKVSVVNQSEGVRFIRTRVGNDFVEPRGSDARVDMTQAKGKFLTGDANDATLFGAFPRDADRPLSVPASGHRTPAASEGGAPHRKGEDAE